MMLTQRSEVVFNPFEDLLRFALTKMFGDPFMRISVALAQVTRLASGEHVAGNRAGTMLSVSQWDEVIGVQGGVNIKQTRRIAAIRTSAVKVFERSSQIGGGECIRQVQFAGATAMLDGSNGCPMFSAIMLRVFASALLIGLGLNLLTFLRILFAPIRCVFAPSLWMFSIMLSLILTNALRIISAALGHVIARFLFTFRASDVFTKVLFSVWRCVEFCRPDPRLTPRFIEIAMVLSPSLFVIFTSVFIVTLLLAGTHLLRIFDSILSIVGIVAGTARLGNPRLVTAGSLEVFRSSRKDLITLSALLCFHTLNYSTEPAQRLAKGGI